MAMKMNIIIKKVMVILLITQSFSHLVASSVVSSARLTGRALAPMFAKQGFKSTPMIVAAADQSNKLSSQPSFNQQSANSTPYALAAQKVVPSAQESHLDMAKWLAVGGAAIAGDMAYEDYKNKYDFSDIDPESLPSDKKTLIAYLQYKFKDIEFMDLDAEYIAHPISSKNTYKKLDVVLKLSKEIAQKNGRYFVISEDVFEACVGERVSEKGSLSTAYHEAGHALINALYLDKIERLAIVTTQAEKFTEIRGSNIFFKIKSKYPVLSKETMHFINSFKL